jgi:type II secretory pathway component PulK
MIEKRTRSYHRSNGAVLLVSLVLLTVMTMIGVAAIDTQTLQSQMARNSLFAQNLYQVSLSEIQAQYYELQGLDYLTEVMNSTTTIDSYPSIELDDAEVDTYKSDDAYSQSVVISYVGDGAPPSGYSIGLFEGKNFEVNSVAEVTGTGSESDQTQGLTYPAPKS